MKYNQNGRVNRHDAVEYNMIMDAERESASANEGAENMGDMFGRWAVNLICICYLGMFFAGDMTVNVLSSIIALVCIIRLIYCVLN